MPITLTKAANHRSLAGLGLIAALLLSACATSEGLDWDLRSSGVDTSDAAIKATNTPPAPDARGVISYPDYQVAVAQPGDTVSSLSARVGLPATEVASYNALKPDDALRVGEVIALPRRVAAAATPVSGTAGAVDVSTIAGTALDRVDSTGGAPARTPQTAGPEPVRYQVKRGETAFTIARSFGISAKALADWNGLDSEMSVREGQFLIIPTAASAPLTSGEIAADAGPGEGSPTPQPPSASEPLPDETTQPAAAVAADTPASPDLAAQATAASATEFAMPASGSIIRGYTKGKNDGIDIAAAAGSPVKAAADGTVAAITVDTAGTAIVVLRHASGLLTVYVGVDAVTVAKGAAVKRGQTIAKVRAGNPAFLHFEVRKGVESVDPLPYLQ